MKTHVLFGRVLRTLSAAGCVALMWLNLFGPWDWYVWLAQFRSVAAPELAWLAPHAVLPLLPPTRRGLVMTVVLYVLVWVFVWYQYQLQISEDPMNADNRGVTGAFFIFGNIAFVFGLLVRGAAALVVVALERRKSRETSHAV